MNAKDAIRSTANLSTMVLKTYVSDLDDANLMCRPGEGCNHLAWQLGHLIASEVHLLEEVAPGKGMELPAGFAEAHAKDKCGIDEASSFHSKDEYLELFDKVREASSKALEDFPEADLDKPAPENYRSFCPTMGDMFSLISTHPMMHAGQFVIVRRKLGKPVLM